MSAKTELERIAGIMMVKSAEKSTEAVFLARYAAQLEQLARMFTKEKDLQDIVNIVHKEMAGVEGIVCN